jgi:hypothetical protein
MEKRKEVHTPEEFLAAFDNNNTVLVFELAKERNPSDKYKLLSGIWEINPKALITEDCDLCVLNIEPTAYRKQILVINKDADKDMDKALLSQMYASGVVPYCYVSYREKKNGIKRCILEKMEPTRPIVMKMNLLIDGGNLLITIRHISKEDHEKKENLEE